MSAARDAHRVVIIGGGAGGLPLAARLGDRHGRGDRVRVTLVDQFATHVWKPLLHEVAGRLGRVAPFEAYCAWSNDPSSGLMTRLVHDGLLGEEEGRTYLEHVYFEEDFEVQRSMVQSRRPVTLLSEVTGGKLERDLRCREI